MLNYVFSASTFAKHLVPFLFIQISSKEKTQTKSIEKTETERSTKSSLRRKTLESKSAPLAESVSLSQKSSRRNSIATASDVIKEVEEHSSEITEKSSKIVKKVTSVIVRPKRNTLAQKAEIEPDEIAPEQVDPFSELTSGTRSKRKSLAAPPDQPKDVTNETKPVASERLKRKSLAKKEEDSDPVKTSSGPVSQSPKVLLRPSVLGDLGASGGQSLKEGSFSATASSSSSLIVEGKRQWKPSLKMQQVTHFY